MVLFSRPPSVRWATVRAVLDAMKRSLSTDGNKSLQVMDKKKSLLSGGKSRTQMFLDKCASLRLQVKDRLVRFHGFMLKQRRLPFTILGREVKFSWTNVCGHGAFLYLAVSYTETDFWNLRLYATGGIILSIFFQYFRAVPLWIPIRWNFIFLIINGVMIADIYRENKIAENISSEQRDIYTKLFRDLGMNSVSYFRLISLGERVELKKGDPLITNGVDNDFLSLVVSGSLDVVREGETVNTISPDQFCGEMSFIQWKEELRKHLLKNPVAEPDSVHIKGTGSIVAAEDTVIYRWHFWDLHKLFLRDMFVGVVVERLLANDLNNKMKNNWNSEPLARYKQILSGAMIDGLITPNERQVLKEFRATHGISEEDHLKVLHKLNWTQEEFKRGYRGVKDKSVDVYASMLMDMLTPARRIPEETKRTLLNFRMKRGITGQQHVVCLNSAGWTLNEYEMSEHHTYIASEDPTNAPSAQPHDTSAEEIQSAFTKYFYKSTGRRKRAMAAINALWDSLFEESKSTPQALTKEQIAAAEALRNLRDPDDPMPKEDDDKEFSVNSWYPVVLLIGAGAAMLNGKLL